MQPHVNMGINFRRRFTISWSKKKVKQQILNEERQIQAQFARKQITPETARTRLGDLAMMLIGLKSHKKR